MFHMAGFEWIAVVRVGYFPRQHVTFNQRVCGGTWPCPFKPFEIEPLDYQ